MAQPQPTLVGSVQADRVVVPSHVGTIVMAAEPRPPQPRSAPARGLPRPFPRLIDRRTETSEAIQALQDMLPVQVFGEPGLGKSALLRVLAHHAVRDAFPDGAVCLPAHRAPLADLLQAFYDAFYERDPAYKPTDAQIGVALQDRQALVLVDDVDLSREDVQRLLDVAPTCGFLLTAERRVLFGEGKALALTGLPPEDALQLVARELGEPLSEADESALRRLCHTYQGHPFRLLQALGLAQDSGRPLSQIVAEICSGDDAPDAPAAEPGPLLTAQLLAGLTAEQRSVLAALASLGGASIAVEHIPPLTQLPQPAAFLETLEQRRLVESHSPRYSIVDTLARDLADWADTTVWRQRALAYFVGWAEAHADDEALIGADMDALLVLHRSAFSSARWLDVLRLGRAIDTTLMFSGRWGAWGETLERCLPAARHIGDAAAEGWVLHQLGSRALCQGEFDTARTCLNQALALRPNLDDPDAVRATQHNLGQLPPPGGGLPRRLRGRGPLRPIIGLAAALIALFVMVIGALAVGGGRGDNDPTNPA